MLTLKQQLEQQQEAHNRFCYVHDILRKALWCARDEPLPMACTRPYWSFWPGWRGRVARALYRAYWYPGYCADLRPSTMGMDEPAFTLIPADVLKKLESQPDR